MIEKAKGIWLFDNLSKIIYDIVFDKLSFIIQNKRFLI